MILACIENIVSCTKYNTVISGKVSAVITHPSQLTAEAWSTGESRCRRARLGGSEPRPPATLGLWAECFLSCALHYRKRITESPPHRVAVRTR